MRSSPGRASSLASRFKAWEGYGSQGRRPLLKYPIPGGMLGPWVPLAALSTDPIPMTHPILPQQRTLVTSPRGGAPGSEVTVGMSGMPRSAGLRISFGSMSAYEVIDRVETDSEGNFTVTVVKSRVVCKSERKLLDASVRLPWRPPWARGVRGPGNGARSRAQ